MKKLNLLLAILVIVSIFIPINARAEEIANITKSHLVDTINTSMLNDEILKLFKSNESDEASLVATETTDGIRVTFTSQTGSQVYDYIYDSSKNILSYTIDTSTGDIEVVLKTFVASFMQFWVYEASQYADKELLSDNFSASSTSSSTEGESTSSTTPCDINENGVCINNDEATHKVTFEFLLTDLFAVRLNEEYQKMTNVSSSIKADDITLNSVTLYPSTEGYKAETKYCYIYRAEEEDGAYEKISASAYNCSGDFGVKDEDLTPGKTYYYKAQYKGSKLYSSPIKVVMLSDEEKNYKNPETGAFADQLLLTLIIICAITSVLVLRRNYKFYKI